MQKYLPLLFMLSLTFCSPKKETTQKTIDMNEISASYIKLALKVGQYVPDYIDAYYGPDSLKSKELTEQEKNAFPTQSLENESDQLLKLLAQIDKSKLSELEQLRHEYLRSQLSAVKAQIQIKGGKKMSFDEEANALYESSPPRNSAQYFDTLLMALDSILPGKGETYQRLEEYKKSFIIPKERLDIVFQAAIKECRSRVAKHIDLPAGENFTVEYVTNKSWSGYNWFKGNGYSLIQVNTDLPIFIDRAIDLACHEGYPGHHTYHSLLEKELVKGKGWMEYSVYPLFSPQAMISEGSANYGIEVAFPENERQAFEKIVLFPLAGLDTSKVNEYYQILKYSKGLSYAGNEAARGYLNGTLSKEEAITWLTKYALMSKERATQRLSFIEKYRSYVISYNLGQDMIKAHVESKVGSEADPNKRWQIFTKIISTPQTPVGLNK